ncbi:Hypothetical predicted protein [Paramuricea clavata]|uniref:ZMYM2-like/QRICH1 C-terminal domain-containing protein n=1 Tax=Paramuricea clavata TaxID=317549 RepID=A0A7D9HVS3_PARCT|nr:Hypothetical predicted protein [Paramuricea clavata]
MAARFADASSVDNFISEQENKDTSQKTERHVKLLHLFLQTKNEERKMEDIPTAELNDSELNTLYAKNLLGTVNPESLLNTLWLNNTMHFGLRSCKEHRDMCWGDVKLKQTVDGEEFLGFNERQIKTRTGSDCRDVRKMTPKMFATDGPERDPVIVYTLYSPEKISENER